MLAAQARPSTPRTLAPAMALPLLVGYACLWGEPTHDYRRLMFMPTAFDAWLAASPVFPVTCNHLPNVIVAPALAGFTLADADDVGLWFEALPRNFDDARIAVARVAGGFLRGVSPTIRHSGWKVRHPKFSEVVTAARCSEITLTETPACRATAVRVDWEAPRDPAAMRHRSIGYRLATLEARDAGRLAEHQRELSESRLARLERLAP